MAKYSIEESTLTSIADAIRTKEGTTDSIAVSDFASRISAIQAGGNIDPSQYAFLSLSDSDVAYDIVDYKYETSDGYEFYTPAIAIRTSAFTGKTIYGFHLYISLEDYNWDQTNGYVLTYWNPSGTKGAEQMTRMLINIGSGAIYPDSMEIFHQSDLDYPFDVVTVNKNSIVIAFSPFDSSDDADFADSFGFGPYLLKVWYK